MKGMDARVWLSIMRPQKSGHILRSSRLREREREGKRMTGGVADPRSERKRWRERKRKKEERESICVDEEALRDRQSVSLYLSCACKREDDHKH